MGSRQRKFIAISKGSAQVYNSRSGSRNGGSCELAADPYDPLARTTAVVIGPSLEGLDRYASTGIFGFPATVFAHSGEFPRMRPELLDSVAVYVPRGKL